MPRRLEDTQLSTRTDRLKLSMRKKPYWRLISEGQHVGYYRGARGGSFVARLFLGAGKYAETKLAAADDFADADGQTVLTFAQAQELARAWFTKRRRIEDGLEPSREGPFTVKDAIEDYWQAHYLAKGRAINWTRKTFDIHIIPQLGETQVDKLTTRRIRDWHHALAKAPARLRTKKTATKQNARPEAVGPDAMRKRRATANRILSVLKAALNHAWKIGDAVDDSAWRKITPFQSVAAPVIRYLTEAECVRLVNACDQDLRQLVRGALLTGARYGELGRLRAGDFNPDSGTITIRTSKSGRARHIVLADEGRKFFDTLTAGKPSDQVLFMRGKDVWGESNQARPLKDACTAAKIKPAVSFHVLRHTYGSTLAMKGAPLAVIAQQLGHADTRMTEKHYAHLSPSYVADTVRAMMPTMGIIEQTNVATLKPKKSKTAPAGRRQ